MAAWRAQAPSQRSSCDSAPNDGHHGKCGPNVAPFSIFSMAAEIGFVNARSPNF